jgi:hypothetical protein
MLRENDNSAGDQRAPPKSPTDKILDQLPDFYSRRVNSPRHLELTQIGYGLPHWLNRQAADSGIDERTSVVSRALVGSRSTFGDLAGRENSRPAGAPVRRVNMWRVAENVSERAETSFSKRPWKTGRLDCQTLLDFDNGMVLLSYSILLQPSSGVTKIKTDWEFLSFLFSVVGLLEVL